MTDIEKQEQKQLIIEAFEEYERRKSGDKLYTINEIRIRLGMSHATISKKVKAGIIESTTDGLISEKAINTYLGKR